MSDVFCGQCGVQAFGGNFCRSCGAPLVVPGTPPAAPAAPAAPATPAAPYQQPQYQQPYQQPQYAPVPAAPLVNPFAGVPLTDLVRDLGALVLLFGSLALPWDVDGDNSDHWWVVIATIVSAVSLSVPYLVKMNVIAGWGGAQSRLVKYAMAVPFLASTVAVVVNELINVNDLAEGYVGPGVGVGLAGALLAAQARASDEEPTGSADALWRTSVFLVLGAGLALVTVTAIVDLAMDVSDALSVSQTLGYTLLVLTSYVLVLALPFVSFLNGGREWGRVLAAAGFAVIATQFLGAAGADDSYSSGDASGPLFQASMEKLSVVFGMFLLAAGTALLVSRPVQRRLVSQPTIPSWVQTARNAGLVGGIALGLTAVGRLLVLVGGENTEGIEVVSLVLLVVGAGASFAISALLAGNPDQARKVVVALTGGILVLAIVEIAVSRSGSPLLGEYAYAVLPSETTGWFVMPGLILFALLYPEEIRRSFQPILGATPGQQAPIHGYQAPTQGFQPEPPAPPADVPPAAGPEDTRQLPIVGDQPPGSTPPPMS